MGEVISTDEGQMKEVLDPHFPQKCKLTSIYGPEYLYENTTKLEKRSFPPPG